MRLLIAAFLAAHGVAHLAGCVASWRLATLPDLPYKTTLIGGRLNVGDAGMRVMGALWLVAAVAFLIAAGGVAVQASWVWRFTAGAVLASLALCAAALPDARVGLTINLALAIILASGAGLNVSGVAR